MLKNYLKIAIAVLRRRKFFTFISLFGISFTLTILLVLTAFIDKVVGDSYPDAKRDKSLYVTNIEETNNTGDMTANALSFYFLDHFAGSLKTPVKVGISSRYNGTNTYVNNKKIAINYKYTNAAYWDIMEYDFLEGKPYSKQQIDNAEKVAVISEDMKNEYFGGIPTVIGKYIEADNIKYRVIGVVKNVPITSYLTYSDIYLPYTVSKTNYKDRGYQGGYIGVLLAASSADVPKMQQEYDQMMSRLPIEDKRYPRQISRAEPYIAAYVNTGDENKSGVTLVLTILGLFVFVFMLLPTLNLVNINITRIMERSSEIGVRKAFGASSKTLVYQFIVENIILTLLGGLIGLILSYIVIQLINSANFIANLQLSINFTVLGIGLLVCLIFGLISGVYPAWRMSKLNVVTALKAQ